MKVTPALTAALSTVDRQDLGATKCLSADKSIAKTWYM